VIEDQVGIARHCHCMDN